MNLFRKEFSVVQKRNKKEFSVIFYLCCICVYVCFKFKLNIFYKCLFFFINVYSHSA